MLSSLRTANTKPSALIGPLVPSMEPIEVFLGPTKGSVPDTQVASPKPKKKSKPAANGRCHSGNAGRCCCTRSCIACTRRCSKADAHNAVVRRRSAAFTPTGTAKPLHPSRTPNRQRLHLQPKKKPTRKRRLRPEPLRHPPTTPATPAAKPKPKKSVDPAQKPTTEATAKPAAKPAQPAATTPVMASEPFGGTRAAAANPVDAADRLSQAPAKQRCSTRLLKDPPFRTPPSSSTSSAISHSTICWSRKSTAT